MTRLARRILVASLPIVLAAAGYVSAPALARLNYAVTFAVEQPWQQPATGAAEPSDARAAFERDQQRRERPLGDVEARRMLVGRAQKAMSAFRIGGALLGVWIGLVAAVRTASLSRVPRRAEYEIEHRICVACGRCFMHCPRERLRRKQLALEKDNG